MIPNKAMEHSKWLWTRSHFHLGSCLRTMGDMKIYNIQPYQFRWVSFKHCCLFLQDHLCIRSHLCRRVVFLHRFQSICSIPALQSLYNYIVVPLFYNPLFWDHLDNKTINFWPKVPFWDHCNIRPYLHVLCNLFHSSQTSLLLFKHGHSSSNQALQL